MATDRQWTRYVETRDPQIRDELVMRNVPLVNYVIGRFRMCCPPGVERDDLLQTGIVGLIQAVERYDPTMDISFSTYAIKRIRGAVVDELRRQDWLPRSVRQRRTELDRAVGEFWVRGNTSPSHEELAEELGVTASEVESTLRETAVTSFVSSDALGADAGAEASGDDWGDPAVGIEREEDIEVLQSLLGDLADLDRHVLVLYYYEGLMVKEVAAVLGISPPYVSRIHDRALFLLRAQLKRAGLAQAV